MVTEFSSEYGGTNWFKDADEARPVTIRETAGRVYFCVSYDFTNKQRLLFEHH
jgi:hypothetical protein